MGAAFKMTAICIANALGFTMALVLLCGNSWLLRNNTREGKCIKHMLLITMASCVVDPLAFYLDGIPGAFMHFAVYACNFWMQLSILAIGLLWLRFIIKHINSPKTRFHNVFIVTLIGIGVAVMIVNFFQPIVFRVNAENIYVRGPLFWILGMLGIIMIGDSLFLYYDARRRGEILMFLSVWQTLLPMTIGMILQSLFYGLSTLYPFMTISIYSIINCLQNEAVYRDSLTGIYNKAFMDDIERRYVARPQAAFTVFMMDLNDFKSINDRFGHQVGNRALIAFANVLRDLVGTSGNAIRYAGDEFLVLLNTQRQDSIDDFIERVQRELKILSDDPSTPYTLSAAIGYQSFDPMNQTFDALLDDVDKLMYADKDIFYAEHPWIVRR